MGSNFRPDRWSSCFVVLSDLEAVCLCVCEPLHLIKQQGIDLVLDRRRQRERERERNWNSSFFFKWNGSLVCVCCQFCYCWLLFILIMLAVVWVPGARQAALVKITTDREHTQENWMTLGRYIKSLDSMALNRKRLITSLVGILVPFRFSAPCVSVYFLASLKLSSRSLIKLRIPLTRRTQRRRPPIPTAAEGRGSCESTIVISPHGRGREMDGQGA